MAKAVTRARVDSVFTLALLVNSVMGFIGVIAFFISAWWVFLILGTIGLPFTITGVLIYRYTRLREPMQKFGKNFVVGLYDKVVQKRGNFIRRIYHAACWFIPNDAWQHINWGYATMTENGHLLDKIESEDEEKRYYNQLYYYMATGMGNWNMLEGKNILELKCGGGGGLSFLSRYLLPSKAIGISDSSSQIEFCKKNFGGNPNMKFYEIDALENIGKIGELCDERIDMAISLQSSKHVKNFKHFIQETENILKPGGVFAFSDIRLTEDWPELERELEGTSMKIIKKEDITKNVIQALHLDELDKWSIMTRRLGSIVRHVMKRIGIVKNNAISESLTAGHTKAMAYILHKMSESNIIAQ